MSPTDAMVSGKSISVSMTVKDVEKSATWYKDVVGFTEERRYDRDGKVQAIGVKGGDISLLLNQDDGVKGWERVKGQGMSLNLHLVSGIDELASRIKAGGWKLDEEPSDRPWGQRMFIVHDPDGYKLAFSVPLAQ